MGAPAPARTEGVGVMAWTISGRRRQYRASAFFPAEDWRWRRVPKYQGVETCQCSVPCLTSFYARIDIEVCWSGERKSNIERVILTKILRDCL